jgi:hypothetical protein
MGDEDYADDAMMDDVFHEEPRGRRRGPEGPTMVTFSVALEQEPKAGEVVVLKGSPTELAGGLQMHPCTSGVGNGRLWMAAVILDIQATASTASAPHFGGTGMMGMGSLLTGLGGFGGNASSTTGPHLFDVWYELVRQSDSTVVAKEEKPWDEHGTLKSFYYHRARFTKKKDEEDDESFAMFVQDEIFQLQTDKINSREFITRFQQLAGAPFAKKRSLLDKAIEQLIDHWGEATSPPMQVLLSIAAAFGHFQKSERDRGWGDMADWEKGPLSDFGVTAMGKDKEKEPPMSERVCTWIVTHCPTRQAVEEEERRAREARDKAAAEAATLAAAVGGAPPPAKERGRERMEIGGNLTLRLTNVGVLEAANRLYTGKKSFDWLKLLNSYLSTSYLIPSILHRFPRRSATF